MTHAACDDTELMRIQSETLYLLDGRRRIIGINEPSQAAETAVFVGTTRFGRELLVAADMPDPIEEALRMQCEPGTDISIVHMSKTIETYMPVKQIWVGPAYVFPDEPIEPAADPAIVLIHQSNASLLKTCFPEIQSELEERQPVIGYVIGDTAVSVCCSARKSAKAAEASLSTAAAFRGRGLGAKAAARWGWEIRKLGQIPLYSTAWDNLSSQRIAHKIGLYQYGMDFHITIQRNCL